MLPTPSALARIRSFSLSSPTHIALTSGLPLYPDAKSTSPPKRWNSDAVPVVTDALHDTGEEIAVPGRIERAEAEAVEHRHRSRAHGEDVAQNAAHSGRGALIRFHRGGVIVRFDLEGDGPALGKSQHAGVFTGSLDDEGTGRREGAENRLRMLVRTMLRP
jgi:hypothetical protein